MSKLTKAFFEDIRKLIVSAHAIHAREYQLYLPSKEVLQKKLVEWAGKAGDA
jgi:hypothetical protein